MIRICEKSFGIHLFNCGACLRHLITAIDCRDLWPSESGQSPEFPYVYFRVEKESMVMTAVGVLSLRKFFAINFIKYQTQKDIMNV